MGGKSGAYRFSRLCTMRKLHREDGSRGDPEFLGERGAGVSGHTVAIYRLADTTTLSPTRQSTKHRLSAPVIGT